MMSTAVQNGKGYEWAIARALSRRLDIPIRDDSAGRVARSSFASLEPEMMARFDLSADAGVEFLIARERESLELRPPRQVHLMSDSAGISGDVRDVVLTAGSTIFGISCKSNHKAYKHPRLSGGIDWVQGWGINSRGASEGYWEAIKPIFSELEQIRHDSNKQALFKDLPGLHSNFYMPVLQAFENELHFQVSAVGSEAVSTGIARYVIGRQDFYKFVTTPRELMIQAYNFEGTLAGSKSSFPSKVLGIDRFEGSRYSLNLRLDRGYIFNFRLHSASSRVEPSLKFDVQAIGLPASEIRQNFIPLDSA